jgi:hypothetical protein
MTGGNIETREFGKVVESIGPPGDVITEYKIGTEIPPNGSNRGEFPYRSIIRGDYESKHFGTISWSALEKFKNFLLLDLLSENEKKLSKEIWQAVLSNYVDVMQAIVTQEKSRWTSSYAYQWNSAFVSSGFLLGNKNFFGQTIGHQYSRLNSTSYTYSPIDYETQPRDIIESRYYRLGFLDEFSLFMPEYESENFQSSQEVTTPVQVGVDEETGEPIFEDVFDYNDYGGTTYSELGMLDDLLIFLENLRDLKYDYSNLDDTLTKNWLYLKLNFPSINLNENFSTAINNSQYPYINEVVLWDNDVSQSVLADVWLGLVIDEKTDTAYEPDAVCRDVWKTRDDPKKTVFDSEEWSSAAETFQEKGLPWGFGEEKRPKTSDYQFQNRILYYSPSSSPLRHSERDPQIIPGTEYVFETTGGQPNDAFPLNEEIPRKFSIVPMRLRLEAVKTVRNDEKVLIMDSITYETESQIEEARELMLPSILDKRLTFYDNNAAQTPESNAIIDFYNSEITREFNDE